MNLGRREYFADLFEKKLEVDWFFHNSNYSKGLEIFQRNFRGVARHENDLGSGAVAGFDLSGKLQAIAFGQIKVAEDEVDRLKLRDLQRLVGVVGLDGGKTVIFEEKCQHFTDDLLIVYDEQAPFFACVLVDLAHLTLSFGVH